jgi:hypothetical protein
VVPWLQLVIVVVSGATIAAIVARLGASACGRVVLKVRNGWWSWWDSNLRATF